MKILKYKIWVLLLFVILVVGAASAQTSEGGGAYLVNGGKIVNCIVKDNYALEGFGISGSSGEVVNCTVRDNYYLNTSVIFPGDMVMGDGTVFSPEYDAYGNLIFPEGYSAADVIGVCFWSNTNNNYLDGKSWIVSVNEVDRYWCPNGMTGSSGWNPVDVATLYNYNNAENALIDYNGLENTELIVAEPGFVENPGMSYALTSDNCAAKYCYDYLRSSGDPVKWFLPSIGQLRMMEEEMTTVNSVMTKLGKPSVTGWYWSSNEVSQQQAWVYHFPYTTNQPAYRDKKSNGKVRPVFIITRN